MSRWQQAWHALAWIAIASLAAWWILEQRGSVNVGADYPTRPIQVVVPYAAGGGSDTFVRILQQGIAEDDLLPQPLVVINQPGGIGTIGSREVKNAEPDGYKILCHHNAIITAKLAGTVSYGPEAFEPIALTGEMSMVILVRADAPYQDVTDLLEEAKASPKTVRFGANKGAPAFFTVLQLEKALPGAEFSIVSSGGGADRYSKILGGHLEAGIFSLSEYLDFRGVEGTPPEQDIRAITVLSERRHESIPEVPTATELGIPVILSNANYWWAPKGTPPSVLQTLANVLERAMQNETVRSELRRLRMDPTFDTGPSLQQELDETARRFEAVATQPPTSLPNFPRAVGLLVVSLLAWVLLESYRQFKAPLDPSSVDPDSEAPVSRHPQLALACFVVLCLYVVVLNSGMVPYAVSTAAMIATSGLLLKRFSPARWTVLLQLSLLVALGTQFLFTEVFETLLP